MKIEKPLEGACKGYEEDLVLHYYGETGENERARIESHLGACEPCRKFLDDLERLLPQMTRTEELPPSFWDNYYRQTMAKLDAHEEKRQRWRSWLAPIRGWMLPAFGTVAAAVLVIGLMFGTESSAPFVEFRSVRIPQEIIADKNQLEFFRSMDMLEALGKLEAEDESSNDRLRLEREQAVTHGRIA